MIGRPHQLVDHQLRLGLGPDEFLQQAGLRSQHRPQRGNARFEAQGAIEKRRLQHRTRRGAGCVYDPTCGIAHGEVTGAGLTPGGGYAIEQ